MSQLVTPTSFGITAQIRAGMPPQVSNANETVTPIDNDQAFPGASQFRQKMAGSQCFIEQSCLCLFHWPAGC